MDFVELNENEVLENNGGGLAGAFVGAVFGTAGGLVIGAVAASIVGANGGTYEEVNETWMDCTKKGFTGGALAGLMSPL